MCINEVGGRDILYSRGPISILVAHDLSRVRTYFSVVGTATANFVRLSLIHLGGRSAIGGMLTAT
jgi:hypothetical protein